ncbi:MAG TPA: KUP/HAK/KT family potassium transporter [Gemmatimonadales bacterium]|nr:KUP/HAK/KT family potassium transporter [Gemmatimonadales bacterium]
MSDPDQPERHPKDNRLVPLAVAALGVVFGDIGTSPLYALKECFAGSHGVAPTRENVLGVLSLVFWSLNFLITFKYLIHMMRADNRGEGGILALLALLRPNDVRSRGRWALILAGVFGAAMLYGDGIITPAISVLGAIDGLSVATPSLTPWVMWISLAIIVLLFLVQRRGTAGIGAVFGPVTIVWFVCIAMLGVRGILMEPAVLAALNPWHAVQFFVRDGLGAFFLLAAVVLVVTGGEALYADMGHFGKKPIRYAWLVVVLPALVLNYFGQGALLLGDPGAAENPFYALVPRWALYPMVGVATAAAITASQALISGAFSLTQQAVQLGFSPRVTIVHTSSAEKGQIYIPQVNWLLMLACVGLVLGFQNASNLAATYGVAVTGTMTTTTILFCAVARERFGWPTWKVVSLGALLLVVDLAFMLANLTKVPHGGWFPLVVAIVIFTLMTTWKRGRSIVTATLREGTLPMELFSREMAKRPPTRVPGVAVFMTSDLSGAPPVLLHHLKHNKVLHEKVVLMCVSTREIPQVPAAERIEFRDLGAGLSTVVATYGFMESPNVPEILQALAPYGISARVSETTFYLGRETLLPIKASKVRKAALAGKGLWMAVWRKKIFMFMTNNAKSATSFFGLPPNRVVELGAQVQI